MKEKKKTDKEEENEKETDASGKWSFRNIWNFLKCFFFKETPPKYFSKKHLKCFSKFWKVFFQNFSYLFIFY